MIHRNLEALLGNSDFVIVCVPLWEKGRMLEEIREGILPGTRLCDIASLKEQSVRILSGSPECTFVSSIHPMFGPHGKGFENRKIILVPPPGRESDSGFFKDFFGGLGAHVVVCDAKRHDELMALTLSLPHFFGYLFHCVISRTESDDLARFGGTSFADMLSFSCRILDEDKRFYFELMKNPSFKKAVEAFRTDARGLIDAIERNDFEGFKDFL